jgi:stalled ribosome rescue protein Dom34
LSTLHNEELSDLYFLHNIVRVVKLHNEELSDLYSLPNIVRVVKSRRMSAYVGGERCAQGSGGET